MHPVRVVNTNNIVGDRQAEGCVRGIQLLSHEIHVLQRGPTHSASYPHGRTIRSLVRRAAHLRLMQSS